jgi:hypothetical protein
VDCDHVACDAGVGDVHVCVLGGECECLEDGGCTGAV